MASTQKVATPADKSNKQLIHNIIGISIMIFFRFLPIDLAPITPFCMNIVGIFLAVFTHGKLA